MKKKHIFILKKKRPVKKKHLKKKNTLILKKKYIKKSYFLVAKGENYFGADFCDSGQCVEYTTLPTSQFTLVGTNSCFTHTLKSERVE